MRALSRSAGVARRAALRLVPAVRRDWIEAVCAEARHVPSGWRRLTWRAGGVQLITREALMRRSIGTAALFAAAATAAAWAAWQGPPAYRAVSDSRVLVIAMIVVLAGLPLLARRLLGPPGSSRTARGLRVGTYAAILALMPARNIIEEFRDVPPRAGPDLRVYAIINLEHRVARTESFDWILFVVIMVLFASTMLWLTSERSRIAPATLAAGAGAGIAVAVVLYAVAPLGLSKVATNPWLPGSDIDPLVALAWILVFFAPLAAGFLAQRRYARSGSTGAAAAAGRARQILAAGLVTNLVGALLVAALGTGTTALMLKGAWLRNWLYHGQHQFFGIAGLRTVLNGNLTAIAYGHELTACVDSSIFLVMCAVSPLLAFALAGMAALGALGNGAAEPYADPPRGGGGPPAPKAVPDGPGGAQLATRTRRDGGPVFGPASPQSLAANADQVQLTAGLPGSLSRVGGADSMQPR